MTDGYDETNKSIEEDWAMADPDFHLKEKLKADNAEIPVATLYAPPDSFEGDNFLELELDTSTIQPETENWSENIPETENTDVWKMPEPVFRSSEGKTIQKSEKRTANPDLPAAQPDFSDKDKSSVKFQPQPKIGEEFRPIQVRSEAKIENSADSKPEKNSNFFFAFGGIFLMLIFATVFIIGIYFLFFYK